MYLCRHFGLPEVADYWESVVALNTWQQHRIARLMVQKLFGTVTGKRLAILGFAFKADTNDTREAPAIRICQIFWRKALSWPFMIPRWLLIRWPGICSWTRAPDSRANGQALSGTGQLVECRAALSRLWLVLMRYWFSRSGQHYKALNWM